MWNATTDGGWGEFVTAPPAPCQTKVPAPAAGAPVVDVADATMPVVDAKRLRTDDESARDSCLCDDLTAHTTFNVVECGRDCAPGEKACAAHHPVLHLAHWLTKNLQLRLARLATEFRPVGQVMEMIHVLQQQVQTRRYTSAHFLSEEDDGHRRFRVMCENELSVLQGMLDQLRTVEDNVREACRRAAGSSTFDMR